MTALLLMRRSTALLSIASALFAAGIITGAVRGVRDPCVGTAGTSAAGTTPQGAAANMLSQRFPALLDGEAERLRDNYCLDTVSGRSAWEKELARIGYLRSWLEERGLTLIASTAWFEVDHRSSRSEDRFRLEITEHATYEYAARDEPLGPSHRFGSRTVHVMEVVRREGRWRIEYDWYLDPLGESPSEPGRVAMTPEVTGSRPDPRADSGRYDRDKAVAYAVAHSGVRALPGGGRYNRDYRVYSYEGGDCASFVSQVLSAGGMEQGYGWSHSNEGSVSWTRGDDLVWFLVATGRGQTVFRGRVGEAVRPLSESPRGPVALLEPGDVIAYEVRGEIGHVAAVTGTDPSGWPVIASHTADRLHFPWDLGWDESTVFWFIHIAY